MSWASEETRKVGRDGSARSRSTAALLLMGGVLSTSVVAGSAQDVPLTLLVGTDALRPLGGLEDLALDPSGNLVLTDGSRVMALVDGELHAIGGESYQVAIDGDRIFWAKDDDAHGAIFRWEAGSAEVVVDEDTRIPTTDCAFFAGENGFQEGWELAGPNSVLFLGFSDDDREECSDLGGTYLWRDGRIHVLIPYRTLVEEEGVRLRCSLASFHEDRFAAYCNAGSGVELHLFEADGTHARIVGPGDPVPGRSTVFASVRSAVLRDGRIAFLAFEDPGNPGPSGTRPGVYVWDGGRISTILDTQKLPKDRMFLPDWTYRFDGRHLAVRATELEPSYGRPFLYVAKADGSEGRPIGGDGLIGFAGDHTLVWLSFGQERSGLRAFPLAGPPLWILRPGDVLDGRIVHSVHAGRSTGSSVPLSVRFTDQSRAIYAAELSAMEVAIDVRPGSRRNRIHPSRRELVPVALLGSADLHVADVDVTSLAFGPNGAPPWRGRIARHDVNGDGLDDLVARFRQRETGIARGDGEACLAGETTDGVAFEGCDAVRTLRARAR